MTLALPTIWGSCSATAFLLIDAQAYTARPANQLSSRQHRAYLRPNKCNSGLKTTYLRFPGEAAKLRRDIPLLPHPFLPLYRRRIDFLSSRPPAVHIPPSGRPPFAGNQGTWHEHWLAITRDIPPRPQQLFTSCRRDHPKSYSPTKTVLQEARNCVPNHSIALSSPALSFISPPSCRRLAGNQPPLFAYSARLQVRTYLLPESVPLAHFRQHTWTRQQFDIVSFVFPFRV